jgi:hypothetical protein
MIQMNDELKERGLPKWPQMYTTGVSVTPEQAKEIIRRTDRFFFYASGGNNQRWADQIIKKLGFPSMYLPNGEHDNSYSKKLTKFHDRWGFVETDYAFNDWISCAYVFGPHGWMHPNGRIGFGDNVGKWPSVQDVLDDWEKLAEAFPFLNVGVTLMSGESCEEDIKKVVSIKVADGLAVLIDPSKENVHANHEPFAGRSGHEENEYFSKLGSGNLDREIGIPKSWIDDWANEFNLNNGKMIK